MAKVCWNCEDHLPQGGNFCPRCGRPAEPESSIAVSQPTLKKVGEFLHKPHYNVRAAAPGYSNSSAVLAGFAVAAVILVIQVPLPPKPGAEFMRDWTAIAFTIAFFGCILSSFIFSVVAGEEILSPRTTMISLFGGIGLSISTSLVFWGLVTLAKVFLSENVVMLARASYVVFILTLPCYLGFSALDNIYLFLDRKPSRPEFLYAFVSSYMPPLTAALFKVSCFSLPASLTVPTLWSAAALSVIIIFASSIFALLMSVAEHGRDLTPRQTWPALGTHSVAIALLILLV